MSRNINKTRAEKVTLAQPPSPTQDKDVEDNVDSGCLTKAEFLTMIAHEEGEEIVSNILDELMIHVMDKCYELYLKKQTMPFTVAWTKTTILQLVKWQYLMRDEGDDENTTLLLQEDTIPAHSITDSWAGDCVEVVIVSNYSLGTGSNPQTSPQQIQKAQSINKTESPPRKSRQSGRPMKVIPGSRPKTELEKKPHPPKQMVKKHSVEDVLNFITDGNTSDLEQLEEGGDAGREEEWSPKGVANTEGSDNSDVEESYQYNHIPVKSKRSTTEQSTKGKVKKKEYSWRNVPFKAPKVKFDEYIEDVFTERLEWTPYMYFKQFVTDKMIQETAQHTNLYSVQKLGKSVKTTPKEIEQVLGMYLHMGLVQMPSVRAYWEMETRYPTVCDVMSRERFLELLTVIHFQNNLSESDEQQKDKLWKIRPWLEKLRQQFLLIPPEEFHAVDEVMVPFKGKSHLYVDKPSKPHKLGFTMWARAGQSGFLYDFAICQGAENPYNEKSDIGFSGNVVLKLTSTLPAGQNYKVFADSYFTSLPLVEHLKERGIYYVGTVQMNTVRNCRMMDENELKKKGRGSWDYRVNQENTIIVRWYDSKAVNLVSSFVGIEPVTNVKCWNQKSKKHIMVPRPAIVETYNKFIGGVDLLDKLSALYKFCFRSRRWYLHIWWHTVTVAVINAWTLYKRDQKELEPKQKPMSLRKFQASVGTSLTSAEKSKIQI